MHFTVFISVIFILTLPFIGFVFNLSCIIVVLYPGLPPWVMKNLLGIEFDVCFWLIYGCSLRFFHMTAGSCAIGMKSGLELSKGNF